METPTVQRATAEPVLRMRGITKRFPGVLANDNVDLDLYPGEVLALLGENGAGKSTLMNILVGLYRPDAGEIVVRGQLVEIHSPRDAASLGIGMVHQNFKLVPTMTVAQNIVLGMQDLAFVPDMAGVGDRIRTLAKRYNMQVDPEADIWQLSVGEQQRVEILKLIYRGADILILDEPTAVLTPQEAEDLGRVLAVMQSEGKSTIFITHKMGEVIAFSNRVCVLRQGRRVAVKETRETSPRELARLMVGREVLFRLDKAPMTPGDPILELRNVHAKNEKGLPALQGVSLTIHQGEILGIAGVAGNGQQELAEVVTGLREITSGDLLINEQNLTNCSPLEVIRSGVSHIPADRMGMGTVGDMAVADNIAMKGYRRPPLASGGLLNRKRIVDFARAMIDLFQIATPTPHTYVKFLSGGNIQKTILAREIDACAGLLVAVYPSRGLDVGATEAVRQRLIEQRDADRGVLLVSEDLDELLSVADRIAVLYEGRVMGILPAAAADVETLGLMMAGASLAEAEA
ncbi:MAG: ABC transporter ATP-binding protein, partial [Anaerolineae bacterium]|nr:ABC transporter ATP-binding protein [Anaerolineae bacterium]